MKNKKLILLAGIILMLIIVVGIMLVCGNKKQAYVISRITAPRYGEISLKISATGTVLPKNRLEIKPAIDGRVEKIFVSEGQKVRSGQILALMSSTERAALIDAARAQGAESLKYWESAYRTTPIIAPITGTVIVRAIEPGQSVNSATAILVLSDRLIVRASVDETDIGSVMEGQNVIINLDAYPEVRAEGRVDLISFESTTRDNVTMYEVDIVPKTVPPVFRSGMTANVDIITRTKGHALLVPTEAIYMDNRIGYVWYMKNKNSEPRKRIVTTGLFDEQNTEILAGLTDKDSIAIMAEKSATQEVKKSGNPFMPQRTKTR